MRPCARLFALVLLLAGLPASAATVTVRTVGLLFSPEAITVELGDTVQFEIAVGHNVVETTEVGSCLSKPGGFRSGSSDLDTSVRSWSITLGAVGTYPYMCTPHCGLGMTGSIVVQQSVDTRGESFSRIKALYEAD